MYVNCIKGRIVYKFVYLLTDTVSQKLKNNNIFTVAKRNVDGQDMLYQSMKLVNGLWVLAELKIKPGNPNFTVSIILISFYFTCHSFALYFIILKSI